jgi:tetratricopeptide (TPR) repeat protein
MAPLEPELLLWAKVVRTGRRLIGNKLPSEGNCGMTGLLAGRHMRDSRTNRLLKRVSAAALGVALNVSCLSDVIRLKNGRQINVERSWVEGNQVRYEIEGNIYGFSRDLVESIESRAYHPEPKTSEASNPKLLTKSVPIEVEQGLTALSLGLRAGNSDIIVDGKLDQEKLREIESEARRYPRDLDRQTRYKSALVELTNFELKNGNQSAALASLQQYLSLDPNHLEANLALASLYLKQGQYSQAENVLSQAAVKHNQSAELYSLLGMAYYLQDKNDRARQAFRRSLDLGFSPDVDQLLKKIDGEDSAESNFKETTSFHFVLKSESTETNQTLGHEVLDTLEKSFGELESALNFSPKETIAVVLYTGEVFRDVTRTPDWVGALNDGKIRLPIKGITHVDYSLCKILKHELTHSFVRLKTGGACPVWLNEGLAQYLVGDSAQTLLPVFKRAVAEHQFLPLQRLELPFVNLPATLATWAYRESLLAVEFMARNYGMGDLQRLLEQNGNSSDFDSSLRRVLRINYAELQKEFEEYLMKL